MPVIAPRTHTSSPETRVQSLALKEIAQSRSGTLEILRADPIPVHPIRNTDILRIKLGDGHEMYIEVSSGSMLTDFLLRLFDEVNGLHRLILSINDSPVLSRFLSFLTD